MTELNEPLFHVVLEGRKVGPYDRRTVVGMRIRHTLTSEDVLVDTDGRQLTVADLIGRRPRVNDFSPNRTGSHSIVRATYPASLAAVEGKGHAIPPFRGEVEARVQPDVLRIAGRFRKGLRWKEDRIKLPLKDIVHARVRGTEVELGLRPAEGQPLQRVSLELFTPAMAAEMLGWLPAGAPWPHDMLPSAAVAIDRRSQQVLWLSVAGATFAVGVVLAVLLARRLY
ncbi:MAG: hypothetical protein ACXWC6_07020 [Ramlibacter sp.]